MAEIRGTASNDTLYSTNEVESIYGKEGNDTIYAGQENDTVYGDEGVDTLRIPGQSTDFKLVAIFDTTGLHSVAPSLSLSPVEDSDYEINITKIEILQFDDKSLYWNGAGWGKNELFTMGNDTVNGSSKDEYIDGLDGDDVISGMKGNDYISGGDGNDLIFGGTGNDFLVGENIGHHLGDKGNDTIHGGEGDDWIDGMRGDDELHGGKGNDTISGFDGNNLVYADSGDDYIRVGGRDTIYGGEGNDQFHTAMNFGNPMLYGGKGADTYIIRYFYPSGTFREPSITTIKDFVQGQDVIDVSYPGYNAIVHGIGSGQTLGYSYQDGNTVIHAEGSDGAVILIGQRVLTESDFIFQ